MGKAYDVLDESKNKIVEREKNGAKRRYELTSNAAKSLSEFLASVCCCRFELLSVRCCCRLFAAVDKMPLSPARRCHFQTPLSQEGNQPDAAFSPTEQGLPLAIE